MSDKGTGLSKADVAKLLADPSVKTRADTGAKIAQQYDQDGLSAAERRLAEDIFRALVKDAEVRVRAALSSQLRAAAELPHDVALSLARDVESVALPMLKYSEVLTDRDLIEIVRQNNPAKQVAIAERRTVSGVVADALIDTGNETAVARLVANEGAELSEDALSKVLERYGEVEMVSDSLARRPSLPTAISEQLVSALTEQLQEVLVTKHDQSSHKVANIVMQARERATVGLLREGSSDEELEVMVEQMHVNGRLTPSLLLRALCMGDMKFFEYAMARLAGVRLANAQLLIHDDGPLGLQSICLKADMPQQLLPAFRAGVDVAHETEFDGGVNDRDRFLRRTLQRVLTYYEDYHMMAEDDLEYLMNKLQHLAA